MPLGTVKTFGHAINKPGLSLKFLWLGCYSSCYYEGNIINFVKSHLQAQEKTVSLLLMQSDGIDNVPYSPSTAARLTYHPSIYDEQRPEGDNVLLLTLCTRNAAHPKFVMLPLDDESFLRGVYEHVSDAIQPLPWDEKISKSFWRGTGSGDPDDNLRKRVVSHLKNSPHADVKLVGGTPEERLTGLYDSHRPLADFARHKYNLVVDGACIASSLQWVFASGCVPILVTHPGNNWWFKSYLEPMKHYVPVAYDLSDVDERLEWLVSHDEEARTIAENAVAFSRYYLSAAFQQYHLAREIDALIQ
jgi:hypothetical protein